MTQVRIEIVVETTEDFNALEAAAEVLFNAGIGNPDLRTGESWCNMWGQTYRIIDWHSTSEGLPIEHHLARKE